LFRTAAIVAALPIALVTFAAPPASADGNLNNVNHIIIVMMENHSFDNYLGALPYVPGTPYHEPKGSIARGCPAGDHTCLDGLKCREVNGELKCRNSNKSNNPGRVSAFHDPRYCTGPDLDHSWDGTHFEVNFSHPENTLRSPRNNGFIRQNALTESPGQDVDHDALGYYTDADLPFYYGLAETFSVNDRYFASVLGQTFPNRAYFGAATSFGHLTTSEILTAGGYQPITGTIYDLMNQNGISWIDYYSDLPYSAVFYQSQAGHTKSQTQFAVDAGTTAALLPQVAFVDPSALKTQNIGGNIYETDEHPPNNIRAGQYFVSNIVNALRNGPHWADSILIITYDEHGGFYDHTRPPVVAQGGQDTPDGINPGQCEDLSNPPASEQPGGGANCSVSATQEAPGICPDFTPTGPYPSKCPTFNQLGVRLPFIVVSPFAKPQYVSHTVGDHTSLLALIEKRFLPAGTHLTARDQNANDLEDMFDFDNSPSLNSSVPTAPLPQPNDPGCPF
jgi:phospholipase C